MAGRITFRNDPPYAGTLYVHFYGIDEALSEAGRSGNVAFFVGTGLLEEIYSYASRRSMYYSYSHVMIGDDASEFESLARTSFKGRIKKFDRINGFFDHQSPDVTVPITESLLRSIDLSFVEKFIDEGLNRFMLTRRSAREIYNDAIDYINIAKSFSVDGPIVLFAQRKFTYLHWMMVGQWIKSGRRSPLVVAYEDGTPTLKADRPIFRRYLTEDEVIRSACSHFGWSVDEVKSTLDIWIASNEYRYSHSLDGTITASEAESFIKFVIRLKENGDTLVDVDAAASSIPRSIPAPVMFGEVSGKIGLDETPLQGIDPMHVVGAARALKNQVNDVLCNAAIENSIPRSSAILGRIANVLLRLEEKSPIEQANIIELGVETSYFERRLVDCQDRLGEHSMEEALSVVGELQRFVARFQTWKAYCADDASEPADTESADLAIEILANAATAGLLNSSAQDRIAEVMPNEQERLDEGKREGIVRSGENFSATVGRAALRSIKQVPKKLAQEGEERVIDAVADASESFLKENAVKLAAFAATRSGGWLSLVMRCINSIS